jgi:indole-3-glycerol phosphate synthase
VNNRDLRTFAVDPGTALRLRPFVPSDCIAVAESGIRTRADVQRLEAAGFDAVLVGECLMRAGDPAEQVATLLGCEANRADAQREVRA